MKELFVSVERRYKLYNGRYYVQGVENINFFLRYLNYFKKVNVIARVEKVISEPVGYQLFEHDLISIAPIFTKHTGVIHALRLIKIIFLSKRSDSCVILRTPGILSYLLSIYLVLFNKKFSLEVVTNPFEEASHLTKNKFLKFTFIKVFLLIFKFQLNRCSFASFVTKNEIQCEFLSLSERQCEKFSSFYSSILLDDDDVIEPIALANRHSRFLSCNTRNLLFIGVLERPFKGLDVFIKLVATLPTNYHATVVGDGFLLNSYKQLAFDLNVADRICFKGFVSDKICKREIMSSADIFVLCSRREGLPRVVIEAMAWGLPCVCSKVSGVSELVDNSYIFPVEDIDAAALIISQQTPESLIYNSQRNLIESLQYKNSVLCQRRDDFYKKVGFSESFAPK